MTQPVARRLLRGFLRVDGFLADRYREALAAAELGSTELDVFHVDAAGFSPEIAAERDDPHYLARGPVEASAVIVSVEQLSAALVHPSLGYARDAWSQVTSAGRKEIAAITLHEALLAEVDHATGRITEPRQLADLARFEIRFRTPGGLIRDTRRLEEMKAEFLRSDRLWIDDDYIRKMTTLSRKLRDLDVLPHALRESRHSLLPFFCPAFGGCYVFEEGASRKRSTTYILSGEAASDAGEDRSARGRRVRQSRLEPEAAVRLLTGHRILGFDPRSVRRSATLDSVQHWVAVEHLLRKGDRLPPSAKDAIRRMRDEGDPPPAWRELEEARRRLDADRDAKLDGLSATTRLRLLSSTSTRPDVQRFVRHVRAFLDPAHLEWWWEDAPDVFFARWPSLDDARRDYFARWLEQTTGAS